LQQAYPENFFLLAGLHPTSVNEIEDWQSEVAIVEQKIRSEQKFYGIGEVGLDLYWDKEHVEEQRSALSSQIDLALEFNLPVVFHTRDAFAETIDLLEGYRGRGLRGVFHSFSGSIDDYAKLRKMGDFLFGVGGVVTYKKSSTADVVRDIALEELVLETDAPYLSPVPMRGKRNESSYVVHTAQFLAQLKGVSLDEVAHHTTKNAELMFGI
jgi:TatD DNase family protein